MGKEKKERKNKVKIDTYIEIWPAIFYEKDQHLQVTVMLSIVASYFSVLQLKKNVNWCFFHF